MAAPAGSTVIGRRAPAGRAWPTGRSLRWATAWQLWLPVAGLAWLSGAVATGHRYPGASLAWLWPAAAGGLLAAAGLAAVIAVAASLGHQRPAQAAAVAARPLWLAWVIVLLLLLSGEANHYFANWPRLRLAALGAVVVPAGLSGAWTLLEILERHRRVASHLLARAGGATLVFAGCLALFVASGGGHLYTPDEWTIYAATAGLVKHGQPAAFADEPYPLHVLGGVAPPHARSPSGDLSYLYPKYGIVPSILGAPLYALASLTGPGPTLPAAAFPFQNRALPLVPLLLNPGLTAATAALMFKVARELGYGRRAALLATLAFAFGSLAWPYSKTLLNMTPTGLFLLLAYWCVLRASRASLRKESRVPGPGSRVPGQGSTRDSGLGTRDWLLGAGCAAGLAVATRYESVLFVAPIAAWAAWPPSGRSLRALALFAAGVAVVVVPLVLGMNVLRTGHPLDAGYGGEGTSLAPKPWYGWFGILLSPGCGLVPHTPLMAMGLLAVAWFWEDAPAPALVAGAIGLLAVAYYGSLTTTWCAFATWGPRYFVAVAPFMALPLAAVWQGFARRSRGRNPFLLLLGGGLLLWSLATNALAVLIDFNRGWQDHWAHGVTYLETSWVPFFSGITSHFRLFREWLLDGRGGLDLYLLYAPGGWGLPLLVVLTGLGGVALATVWLAQEARPAGWPAGRA
ncbi:MAG TPA: hypothetical protein VHS99_06895, partial [Chloroflexota bacterium]|nr:hypothetical protein [Chloroflexota bacterium]